MIKLVTVVQAYYDNPTMLVEHLCQWWKYPPGFEFIIVDDGSPRWPAEVVLRSGPRVPGLRLFRVLKDIPWNQDGARNLGMANVQTKFAWLADMDQLLPIHQADLMRSFCQIDARDREYYMPMRIAAKDGSALHPHPNCYLFQKKDFWEMGGYDEDFAGCYGSDGNFRKCMRAGLREVSTGAWHTVSFGRDEIPDASTTNLSRKDGPYWRPNFPHLEAKRRAPPYRAINHVRFPWMEVRL